MATYWAGKNNKEIISDLKTDLKSGLSATKANERLFSIGKNVFSKGKVVSLWDIISRELKNPLVFILVIAGIITMLLHHYIDAGVIFLAILISIFFGAFQEKKADKSFQKLNDSRQTYATVLRNGSKKQVSSEELTRGDIVYLESGNYVPADIRLLETRDLSINESVLTGEWLPREKDSEVKKIGLSIIGQTNMAWMGTFVASGIGTGVVVEVGDRTEIGKIAKELLLMEERDTPIKKNIKKLSRVVLLTVVFGAFLIFLFGILRGEGWQEMFLVAVAIAVSAIPEGMPAAVTVVLAIGMERILKKGGLVRSLTAAETLGSTTVILTDKTGTLTEAKMKLAGVFTLDSILHEAFDVEENREALKMGVLSSDAYIETNKNPEDLLVRGRPLERAIVGAGISAGIKQSDLDKKGFQRIDFSPFSSERGYMFSLNHNGNNLSNRLYISGSPEAIFSRCAYILRGGQKTKITENWTGAFKILLEKESSKGMRLTGLAYKDVLWNKLPDQKNKDEKELFDEAVFVGFLSFSDPVRRDVSESIASARHAGAEVIMVTGDSPETALTVAKESGIIKSGRVLSGEDIEEMADGELSLALSNTKVFARILPSQKSRIVKILKERGEIVAMTGDGVNDAPALRFADIGIAVGSGTEVAKEASDLILLDDSFSIIVGAIEEGRRITDNLKKIIAYLLSTSFGEVFIVAGAIALSLPLPILPVQILWVNLIGEGFLNFAFAFENADKTLMSRNPRSASSRNIFSADIKKLIWFVGTLGGLSILLLYFILLSANLPIEEIRTVLFVALALDSIFFALSFKNLREPFWKTEILGNRYLLFSLFVSASLLMLTLSLEPLKKLLSLSDFSVLGFVLLSALAIIDLLIIEGSKYFIFGRSRA